jgi:hypothetical protein
MDEMLAVQMLRVSLPDEGSSLSLDKSKLLSVIADTFSRDKELREVFVCMAESNVCERMYFQRESPDFASYVQNILDSFKNNNPYASEVIQRAFSLWAKTVCPTYSPSLNSGIKISPETQKSTQQVKFSVPISIVSKYKPPKSQSQSKRHSKVWRVVTIILLVLMGLALIGWLWIQFPIARIIIGIVAAIILFMGLIIFSEA